MNMKTFNNKMKSFKQFIDAQDSDSDSDPFLEMPIRIKASFFNPTSRVQVVFFQHVLNRTQKQNSTNPNSQPSTHLHKKRASQT